MAIENTIRLDTPIFRALMDYGAGHERTMSTGGFLAWVAAERPELHGRFTEEEMREATEAYIQVLRN